MNQTATFPPLSLENHQHFGPPELSSLELTNPRKETCITWTELDIALMLRFFPGRHQMTIQIDES